MLSCLIQVIWKPLSLRFLSISLEIHSELAKVIGLSQISLGMACELCAGKADGSQTIKEGGGW